MALVVEDGTGLTNANAYISVAFADTYHRDRGNDAWAAVGSKAKQQAIIKATEFIDSHFEFQGDRVVVGDGDNSVPPQALAWPREGIVHPEGYVVDPAAVPKEVQRATAELALVAAGEDLEPTVSGGFVSSTSERVGRVSITTNFGGAGGSTGPAVPKVAVLLRPLLASGGGFGTSRVLRA